MSWISSIPDMDDEFIGYAILMIMVYFMFIWITTPNVSPINVFPNETAVGALVIHLEVILVVIIPFTMLGIVETMFPSSDRKVRTVASNQIERATFAVQRYHAKHMAKYGRYKKSENKK